MRIVSVNAWGGKLHERLVPYLQSADADVLCLQEVVSTPATDREWLTYRDGDHVLPQRANLLGDLRKALPDHQAIFCPAAQGELWDGDTAIASQWGLATFVRHNFPVVGQRQGFVHGAFSPKGFGPHPRSRSAHVVRLYDYAADRTVTVAQMHGLRDLAGKMDTPERLAQAHRFAALIESVAEGSDALVICGDFNVEPDSETFAILGALGVTELVTSRGFEGTRTSHYAKPGRFADYMLLDRRTPVAAFTVVRQPEVSDHCPLVLDI